MHARTALFGFLALALTAALGACGDDPSAVPGSALVKWSLGPVATCETLHLETIKASAIRGGEELGSASGPCNPTARSGELEIFDLTPARYAIEVVGIDAQGVKTHIGTLDRLTVPDGGQGTHDNPIVVAEKPVTLGVDWDLGGKCSSKGVLKVEVQLFYKGSIDADESVTVDCDATYVDPETDAEQSGVLLEDLEGGTGVVLLLYGQGDKSKRIMQGQTDPFDLVAGLDLRKVVPLETCPGDPPTCN